MKRLIIILFMICGVVYGQSTNESSVTYSGSTSNLYSKGGSLGTYGKITDLEIGTLTVTNMLTTTYQGSEDLRMPLSSGGRQDDPPDLATWLGNLKAYAFAGTTKDEQVFLDVQFPRHHAGVE